ncbi:unnamed protein product, partial [Closterium sp. NIES-64]
MAASTSIAAGSSLKLTATSSLGAKSSSFQEFSEGSIRSISLKSTKPAVSKAQSGQSANGKNRMVVKAMAPNALVDINAADEVKFKALVSRRASSSTMPTGSDDGHRSSGGGVERDGCDGILPEWAPVLHISNLPFSLTAPALSFLLFFRTNASYGRFDEARKMWGLMLNRTRDITRQALSYMARDQYTYEYPKRAQFIRHLQAFPLTYKHHFIQEGSLEEDLREANFATFADDIGGSERLFKTPIPLSYTRLTSRFLVLYHMFLPFALWDPLGWLTIPVTATCAAVFFCIEEVGVLIENPFPILALVVISQSARNNAGELVALHEGIRNLVAEDDLEMKNLSARKQEALLQTPQFVAEPEPEYMSDWDEDAAALTPFLLPTTCCDPYR